MFGFVQALQDNLLGCLGGNTAGIVRRVLNIDKIFKVGFGINYFGIVKRYLGLGVRDLLDHRFLGPNRHPAVGRVYLYREILGSIEVILTVG